MSLGFGFRNIVKGLGSITALGGYTS